MSASMRAALTGYVEKMTSTFVYLLAILLVPLALALMLFVMAHLEGESTSTPKG